jgi:hypothetical protein
MTYTLKPYLLNTEKARIQEALTYALIQIRNHTERRLIAQEFWHSLNRKGLISNGEVESLIYLTLKDYKQPPP